jgi:hypothetical protein
MVQRIPETSKARRPLCENDKIARLRSSDYLWHGRWSI